MVTMTEMYTEIFPNFKRERKRKKNKKKQKKSRDKSAYAFLVREGETYTEVSQGLHCSGH